MKFLYHYRTSDNVQHEGVINAATKDAAYDALRSQGIKPGRMVEAPGIFNKLFGKGKRWIAIGVLALLATILAGLLWNAEEAVSESVFRPSAKFLALQSDVDAIIANATNDVRAAREKVKTLFRERYPELPQNPREREEAQALYGRATFRLDDMESAYRLEEEGGDAVPRLDNNFSVSH